MDELDAIAARVRESADRGAGPWTLELYPTLRCNLDCAFCDTTDRHRPPVNELPTERQVAIVDEAAALGVRQVMVLGGGEPLLSAAFPAVARRVKHHGMRGFLTTNGTRLDVVGPMLAEIGWDEVHVSVDGATPATHDALRGKRGAFAKTVGGACRLRRRGVRLGVHTVLTNRNVDELADLVRLAAAIGAWRVEVDALIAYRPEQQALALGDAERERLPIRMEEARAEAEKLGISTNLDRPHGPRGAHAPESGTGEGLAKAPCLKAWHHLVVQADGRTAPCCVLAGVAGSVAEVSVAEVWREDETFRSIRQGMLAGRPTGRCAECSENILAHERAIRARL